MPRALRKPSAERIRKPSARFTTPSAPSFSRACKGKAVAPYKGKGTAMAVAARENGIKPRRVIFKGAKLAFVRRDDAYAGDRVVTRDDEPARFHLGVDARPGVYRVQCAGSTSLGRSAGSDQETPSSTLCKTPFCATALVRGKADCPGAEATCPELASPNAGGAPPCRASPLA